jgi:hypothetical protein
LLAAIEKHPDARFVRNGTEYTAKDAANHLRSKYQSAKDHVRTPQDFIDKIASKSSTSGEEYEVRLPGKAPLKARAFLLEELKGLQTTSGPGRP